MLHPDGDLVSGNGYRFAPWRMEAWPLLCEQARFWRADYAQRADRGAGVSPARPQVVTLQPEASPENQAVL
ncbi:hypothetical protein PCA_09590 [Rhodanobacter sp. PCA2]|nr:hypothetical protein [Rhodanobacter sp. PCA2]